MANQISDLQPWLTAIHKQGLNPDTIALHRRRLLKALQTQIKPEFTVIDTCRLDNGGLLSADWLNDTDQQAHDLHGYAAFIPAAGAASRYLNGLSAAETTKLLTLLDEPQAAIDENALVQHPKAYFPCTPQGPSFLAMKCHEHAVLPGIDQQIFVAPFGHRDAFAAACAKVNVKTPPTLILEQGMQLSTVRFDATGTPVTNADGTLSVVPAGHGMLIELFAEIKNTATMQGIHSLLIRNIDNISGTHAQVRVATAAFLRAHQRLLEQVRKIRAALERAQIDAAADVANSLLPTFTAPELSVAHQQFLADCTATSRPLWQLQLQLFGLDPDSARQLWPDIPGIESLRQLYARPVNMLGQVPNSGKDVGGTPVWTRTPRGNVRICLELPHASAADRQAFIADPAKATHFNPVFVAAEIATDLSSYQDSRDIFWIMACKQFDGRDVYYHETVLYELLGNSLLANSVFMEIPRFLFNPHKSHNDTLTNRRDDWLAVK